MMIMKERQIIPRSYSQPKSSDQEPCNTPEGMNSSLKEPLFCFKHRKMGVPSFIFLNSKTQF